MRREERLDKVRDEVETLFRERFSDVDIVSVTVTPDVDEDGDEILRVRVVFDGNRKQLDARKTSGFLRYMRPRIAKIGEEAFPIVSFIANSDFRKSKPDAA